MMTESRRARPPRYQKITARVTNDELAAVDALAAERGVSRGAIVREALAHVCAQFFDRQYEVTE